MKTIENIAVALRYESTQTAPQVIASGKGALAEQIIQAAKEHHVPLHEDSLLAEMLSTLDINEEIPEILYVLVAEIIACVYQLNEDMLSKANKLSS